MVHRHIEAATATTLTIGGRELLSFAGTSYLGLGHHPAVLDAVREALGRCGLTAAASRVTSGNFAEHEALEEALARFLGVDAVAITPDGWLADAAALTAHFEEVDGLALDESSHAALWSAAALVSAHVWGFDGEDMTMTRAWLEEQAKVGAAILTDGVFPMAQRIPDLAAIVAALPATPGVAGLVVVDDSHGLGMLGEGGRGSVRAAGLADERIVTTGSLAKSLGAAGGFVAGSFARIERVRASGQIYDCTTPIPPAVSAGARAAIEVLEQEPERHARLLANAAQLGGLARVLDIDVHPVPIPVLAVPLPDESKGRALERALEQAGIFAPWTTYGGGAGDLRIAVTSEHTAEDLARLSAVLESELSTR